MSEFDLQLFGKGGGDTTVQSYQPSEHELELQRISKEYAEAVAPNAKYLNDTAKGLLERSLGEAQVDYTHLTLLGEKSPTSISGGMNRHFLLTI